MVKKHFPIIFFIVILVLAFLVVQPFIKAILFSAVFAYLFYPLNKYLKKKIKNKNLASLITTILILLIAIIPSFFVAEALVKESYSTYFLAKQKLMTSNICENSESFLCSQWTNIKDTFLGENLNMYLKIGIDNFSSRAISGIYNLIKGIAESIMQIFIFIILLFFLLRDGELLLDKLYKLLPFKEKDRKETVREVANILHAVVYGSIIIAFVQGLLAFLGFLIFGITNPLLWGILVLLASFVPFLGTTLVWLPLTLVYLGDAIIMGETSGIIRILFLLLYCTFIVSGIDNILKPKLIGDRTKLHPALIFLGVIGGLYLLGPIGVFIGPVIMAILVVFIRIYEDDNKRKSK